MLLGKRIQWPEVQRFRKTFHFVLIYLLNFCTLCVYSLVKHILGAPQGCLSIILYLKQFTPIWVVKVVGQHERVFGSCSSHLSTLRGVLQVTSASALTRGVNRFELGCPPGVGGTCGVLGRMRGGSCLI